MYGKEIREMSDNAILDAIEDQKLAIFNLRFQRATGQLEDTNAIRRAKRDLARLKTILRERQLAAQAVKEEGGQPLHERLALALLADAVDDLVALAPKADEFGHDLRRILQVGVDDDGGPAAGVVQAGGRRHLVAEVARQGQQAYPRVLRRLLGQDRPRAVGRGASIPPGRSSE